MSRRIYEILSTPPRVTPRINCNCYPGLAYTRCVYNHLHGHVHLNRYMNLSGKVLQLKMEDPVSFFTEREIVTPG